MGPHNLPCHHGASDTDVADGEADFHAARFLAGNLACNKPKDALDHLGLDLSCLGGGVIDKLINHDRAIGADRKTGFI